MAQQPAGVGGAGIAKVLVTGNVAVGKTSVISRYARNKFSKDHAATIGVDFALKRVRTGATELNVQLWDLAGQERFVGLSRIFYTHAVAAIIVFDLTSRDSFENVSKWKADIDSKVFLPSGAKIPVLLLGNKADLIRNDGDGMSMAAPAAAGSDSSDSNTSLQSSCVSRSEMDNFVSSHGFLAFYPVSAATGFNVKESCNFLIQNIQKNYTTEFTAARLNQEQKSKEEQEQEERNRASNATVKLSASAGDKKGGGGGCCG